MLALIITYLAMYQHIPQDMRFVASLAVVLLGVAITPKKEVRPR